jgi:hypothetical protein
MTVAEAFFIYATEDRAGEDPRALQHFSAQVDLRRRLHLAALSGVAVRIALDHWP